MRCLPHATLRASQFYCLLSGGFAAGVLATFFLGWRDGPISPQQQERIICKELRVETLVLVDRNGKQVGIMRPLGTRGAEFVLGYGKGKPGAALQAYEIEGAPVSLIKLNAPVEAPPPGKPLQSSAFLSCGSGWPSLYLTSSTGRLVNLGSDSEHPETALTLSQRSGKKTKWPK